MRGKPVPFEKEIFVSQPMMPPLEKFHKRLSDVWESKWLTNLGVQHITLEDKLRGILKVNYLALCNNGTSALLLALKALDIGGEVITTPFTFPATVNALTFLGIRPVFCDIDPITFNINPARIESLITPQTSAILGVHVFGNICDTESIQKIADQHHLKVIYDAAHAFGVEVNGKGVGTLGDISTFSFHATKLFHTAEGGAISFNDEFLYHKMYLLKNFGIESEDEVVLPGINAKMNEIQAALGLEVCELIEDEIAIRKKLADRYVERLADVEGLILPLFDDAHIKRNYQYMNIQIDKLVFGCSRDDLYNGLKEFNVFSRKYFYPLCSSYEWNAGLESARETHLIVASKVVNEILILPLHGALRIDDIDKICDMVLYVKKVKHDES